MFGDWITDVAAWVGIVLIIAIVLAYKGYERWTLMNCQ